MAIINYCCFISAIVLLKSMKKYWKIGLLMYVAKTFKKERKKTTLCLNIYVMKKPRCAVLKVILVPTVNLVQVIRTTFVITVAIVRATVPGKALASVFATLVSRVVPARNVLLTT